MLFELRSHRCIRIISKWDRHERAFQMEKDIYKSVCWGELSVFKQLKMDSVAGAHREAGGRMDEGLENPQRLGLVDQEEDFDHHPE